MAVPKAELAPKSREELWKETITGGIVTVVGIALIWQYTAHSEHGHTMELAVLWTGVGIMAAGLFMLNKKLVKEFFAELRKFIPFLKNGDA